MSTLLSQELRYSIRNLVNDRGFTTIVLLTLAVGIATNTIVFSAVKAVLLDKLPYKSPNQLALIWQDNPQQNDHEGLVSIPNFVDWKNRNQSFEEMAAYVETSSILRGEDASELVRGATVTTDFISVIGVAPVLGRAFLPEEAQEGRDLVVLLGYGLWQRQFGGDPDVIGKTVPFERQSRLVIGVMPPDFDFPAKSQFWLPLVMDERRVSFRNHQMLTVIGRLEFGTSISRARADMSLVAQQLSEEYPTDNQGLGINLISLRDDELKGVGRELLVLWLAVAAVLLTACLNLVHLSLVRAMRRRKEIAIRSALGATRGQIVRQFVLDGMLICVAGWLFGLIFALWGLRLILGISPPVPHLARIGIDSGVVNYAFLVSVLIALLISLAPCLQLIRFNVCEALKETGPAMAPGWFRGGTFRKGLIMIQVATALTLSISGGLLVRSFWKVQQVSPGFDANHLLKAAIFIPPTESGPAKPAFIDELKQRLHTLDGISAVGAASAVLLDKVALDNLSAPVIAEVGFPDGTSPSVDVSVTETTSDYFEVMGVTFLSGGSFDGGATEEEPHAVINQELARRFWPGVDPVGKRFRFNDSNFKSPWLTVRGVVADSRRQGLDGNVGPEIFMPMSASPWLFIEIVARTTGDPKPLLPIVRSMLKTVDKDLVIVDIRTVEELLGDRIVHRRFMALVLGGFAVSALVLASIGTYGVTAYTVQRRTREIGIRLAVGASHGVILKLLLKDGAKPILLGILLGSLMTTYLTKSLSSFLFGVVPSDPVSLVTATLTLCAAAFLACFLSALRSRDVDPLTVLRSE